MKENTTHFMSPSGAQSRFAPLVKVQNTQKTKTIMCDGGWIGQNSNV